LQPGVTLNALSAQDVAGVAATLVVAVLWQHLFTPVGYQQVGAHVSGAAELHGNFTVR
jgi:hypothetical protein